MKRSAVTIVAVLVALCTSAFGAEYYVWEWQPPHDSVTDGTYHLSLTANNGSHAVALGEYGGSPYHDWTSVAARAVGQNDTIIYGYEWLDGSHASEWPCDDFWRSYGHINPCVAANNNYKIWLFADSCG